MATPIEYSTILRTDQFVPVTSRYADSKLLYYGEDRKITFATYKRHDIVALPSDKVAVIPPGMEYRPDLVSREAYGVVDFWWKIMEFNNIKDIFEFKAGKVIRIPEGVF